MKKEYDFSTTQRGKFFREDATLNLPIYLETDTRAFVEGIAARKKKDVSTVVNELLRSDRLIVETAEWYRQTGTEILDSYNGNVDAMLRDMMKRQHAEGR